MKLSDIPKGSTLYLTVDGRPGTKCTFHNLDGSYSYCTVDEGPRGPDSDNPGIFHMYRYQELVPCRDGYTIPEKTDD